MRVKILIFIVLFIATLAVTNGYRNATAGSSGKDTGNGSTGTIIEKAIKILGSIFG